MSKQHKHAELIHAFADGAEIQVLESDFGWIDIDNPSWLITAEYRIKPKEKQKVKMWQWVYRIDDVYRLTEEFLTEREAEFDLNIPDEDMYLVQRAYWTEIEVNHEQND